MSRILLAGLAIAALSFFAATEAMAQRDAGAKARGDYSGTFWSQGNRGSSRMYSRQSGPAVSESYRRFSYAPVGINPGDNVTVSGDNVKMMKGANVVGAVPNGLEFKVTKIIDGWLGAIVEVDGQTLNGWIWHENVAGDGLAARDQVQSQSERRFSFEPAEPSRTYRSYRSYDSGREPWQYPKTDPRRFRPRGS